MSHLPNPPSSTTTPKSTVEPVTELQNLIRERASSCLSNVDERADINWTIGYKQSPKSPERNRSPLNRSSNLVSWSFEGY